MDWLKWFRPKPVEKPFRTTEDGKLLVGDVELLEGLAEDLAESEVNPDQKNS